MCVFFKYIANVFVINQGPDGADGEDGEPGNNGEEVRTFVIIIKHGHPE